MGIEFSFKAERKGKNAELMFMQFMDFYCAEIEEFRDYVHRFLNPNYKKDGVEFIKNLKFRLELLQDGHSNNIAEYIKAMEYKEFLKTLYWQTISEYKKNEADNKCQLCNKGGVLHTHHRTYSIHGYEVLYPEDLIVLCEKCHSKFHGKDNI
ncbi:MAG: hypothetical protein LBC76_08065 [Treponema sp.]|jgi:hypothetical protein|nr:hypothetical protein [Treponema sp.]